MSNIVISAESIKQKIIDKAVGDGDSISIYAFGPDADNWKGSTSEIGKNQSMMTMLGGVADSITGCLSPTGSFYSLESQTFVKGNTGDFVTVVSDNFKVGSSVGQDGSVSFISSLEAGGLGYIGLRYKTRTITFSKGILTSIDAESLWNNL